MVDELASTRAFIARRLHLLNHWSHLAKCNFDTAAATAAARPYGTLFTALAIALGADDVSRKSELGRFAFIEVFKGDSDAVMEIFRFAGPR
jgi:hypothetical protein